MDECNSATDGTMRVDAEYLVIVGRKPRAREGVVAFDLRTIELTDGEILADLMYPHGVGLVH